MGLTTTEVFGFANSVSQFMQANQPALVDKGLNVTTWIDELNSECQDAITKNEAQEALKAQMRAKTEETNRAIKSCYESASTRLDALIGTLGKTSELGRQAARLRSDVRRGARRTANNQPAAKTT